MSNRMVLGACALALLGAGCGGFGDESLSVDMEVTWNSDIQEILASNCVGCHTSPSQNGAPGGFRFDQYKRGDIDDSNDGAFEMANRIKARAVDQVPSAMPPGGGLSLEEQALIATWVENGAPLGDGAGLLVGGGR